MMASPASFHIQPATPEHSSAIRRLVIESGINPTGLDWQRFLVALTPDGEFIGCGQIKPHADGTMELASIAVAPAWRGRGVARAIIEALLALQTGDLYLMCQSSLGSLYEKFGFRAITVPEMPTYFRRVSKLAGVVANLRLVNEILLVMRKRSNS
jgi:amino-acid N-acetyltransferase